MLNISKKLLEFKDDLNGLEQLLQHMLKDIKSEVVYGINIKKSTIDAFRHCFKIWCNQEDPDISELKTLLEILRCTVHYSSNQNIWTNLSYEWALMFCDLIFAILKSNEISYFMSRLLLVLRKVTEYSAIICRVIYIRLMTVLISKEYLLPSKRILIKCYLMLLKLDGNRLPMAFVEDNPLLLKQFSDLLKTEGDYEFQVDLLEVIALCTSQNKEITRSWFDDKEVNGLFQRISQISFEQDSRKFLNCLNKSLGTQQRVYSMEYYHLELGERHLSGPAGETMWLDINLDSKRLGITCVNDGSTPCDNTLLCTKYIVFDDITSIDFISGTVPVGQKLCDCVRLSITVDRLKELFEYAKTNSIVAIILENTNAHSEADLISFLRCIRLHLKISRSVRKSVRDGRTLRSFKQPIKLETQHNTNHCLDTHPNNVSVNQKKRQRKRKVEKPTAMFVPRKNQNLEKISKSSKFVVTTPKKSYKSLKVCKSQVQAFLKPQNIPGNLISSMDNFVSTEEKKTGRDEVQKKENCSVIQSSMKEEPGLHLSTSSKEEKIHQELDTKVKTWEMNKSPNQDSENGYHSKKKRVVIPESGSSDNDQHFREQKYESRTKRFQVKRRDSPQKFDDNRDEIDSPPKGMFNVRNTKSLESAENSQQTGGAEKPIDNKKGETGKTESRSLADQSSESDYFSGPLLQKQSLPNAFNLEDRVFGTPFPPDRKMSASQRSKFWKKEIDNINKTCKMLDSDIEEVLRETPLFKRHTSGKQIITERTKGRQSKRKSKQGKIGLDDKRIKLEKAVEDKIRLSTRLNISKEVTNNSQIECINMNKHNDIDFLILDTDEDLKNEEKFDETKDQELGKERIDRVCDERMEQNAIYSDSELRRNYSTLPEEKEGAAPKKINCTKEIIGDKEMSNKKEVRKSIKIIASESLERVNKISRRSMNERLRNMNESPSRKNGTKKLRGIEKRKRKAVSNLDNTVVFLENISRVFGKEGSGNNIETNTEVSTLKELTTTRESTDEVYDSNKKEIGFSLYLVPNVTLEKCVRMKKMLSKVARIISHEEIGNISGIKNKSLAITEGNIGKNGNLTEAASMNSSGNIEIFSLEKCETISETNLKQIADSDSPGKNSKFNVLQTDNISEKSKLNFLKSSVSIRKSKKLRQQPCRRRIYLSSRRVRNKFKSRKSAKKNRKVFNSSADIRVCNRASCKRLCPDNLIGSQKLMQKILEAWETGQKPKEFGSTKLSSKLFEEFDSDGRSEFKETGIPSPQTLPDCSDPYYSKPLTSSECALISNYEPISPVLYENQTTSEQMGEISTSVDLLINDCTQKEVVSSVLQKKNDVPRLKSIDTYRNLSTKVIEDFQNGNNLIKTLFQNKKGKIFQSFLRDMSEICSSLQNNDSINFNGLNSYFLRLSKRVDHTITALQQQTDIVNKEEENNTIKLSEKISEGLIEQGRNFHRQESKELMNTMRCIRSRYLNGNII